MKNKQEIYIGGTKYFVKHVDRIKKPKGVYGRHVEIFGQFRPRTNEVVIRRSLGYSRNTTITHELIHAISHELCFMLSEQQVDALSRELVGTLSQLGIIK